MSGDKLASIIISSYNYGCFLRDCIESALNQTYPHIEVLVVDDASTDNSCEIIRSYRDRIIPILREKNAGGRATYNDACGLSRGQVILLLDSDDMLCPTAIERAMPLFDDPNVVKVHWPLWKTDARGRKTGRLDPGSALPHGDYRQKVARSGPFGYSFPSTSGNAYARCFLESVLPVPPECYGDAYLATWALVSGRIARLSEPQGYYRLHDGNTYGSKPFEKRLERDFRHAEQCCQELSAYFRNQGIEVDTESWKRDSWYHRLYLSAQDIRALIPEGTAFLLADQDNWATGGSVAGRPALPFTEQNGEYGGPPRDAAAAIKELECRREEGIRFLVFAWQAFWWLEYYTELRHYLRAQCHCLLENERLVVFNLQG